MKKLVSIVISLTMLLSLAACSSEVTGAASAPAAPAAAETETAAPAEEAAAPSGELDVSQGVKVGVLFPVTGAAASVAEDARKGIDLGIEWINSNGGIEPLGGAQIVPIYADTQSDEQEAVKEAERLIVQEGVACIIGCYQSAVTLPVRTVCENYGCPLLMCCCSAPTLVEGDHDWSFLVHETSAASVDSQLRYIREITENGTFEIKTAALLYENNDNGQSCETLWTEAFNEMGIEIVVNEAFSIDVADVTPIVNKLQSANPDIVMCFADFDPMVLLTETFVGKGYAPNLMMCASGGEQNSDFIPTVGNDADGFMTAMGWGVDCLASKPDKLWITEDYAAANNGESFTGESAAGWSDIFLLYEALNAAGKLDRTAIRDALKGMKITEDTWWNIYPYEIEFNSTGANFNAISPLGQFQDTHVTVIWPEGAVAPGAEIVLPGSELSVLNQ